MARDLIAIMRDVPADSFDIKIKVELPHNAQAHLEAARDYHERATAAASRAAAETKAAACALADSGVTLRDIGKTLGVSHQRAHQLLAGAGRRSARSRSSGAATARGTPTTKAGN